MNVALLWPFGTYKPGDVVDCDPALGAVLVKEGFATESPEVMPPPEPANPTVAELRQFARDHNLTVTEAKQRLAADRTTQRQGVTR